MNIHVDFSAFFFSFFEKKNPKSNAFYLSTSFTYLSIKRQFYFVVVYRSLNAILYVQMQLIILIRIRIFINYRVYIEGLDNTIYVSRIQ